MRQLTPTQLRKAIDYLRTRQLRLEHTFEQYEAIVVNTQCPIDKTEWLQNIEMLRGRNRINRENLRKRLTILEGVLAEDEAMNGWKGEDRFIEGVAI